MSEKNSKLPQEVTNRILRGVQYTFNEREDVFNKFVEKFLKLKQEDPENFMKNVIHLDKTSDKKTKKRDIDVKTKRLSFRKRKELGLYSLGKKTLKYNDLLPLHKLWKDYFVKFMNLDELQKQKWTNHHEDPNFEQVSMKLYRADYHGSTLSVIKSTCPSYTGKMGIVAMETKNCFKLLGNDNITRCITGIPKACCMFMFKLNDFQFTFFGKNLQGRPAERSSKKLKTIYTSDLQLL